MIIIFIIIIYYYIIIINIIIISLFATRVILKHWPVIINYIPIRRPMDVALLVQFLQQVLIFYLAVLFPMNSCRRHVHYNTRKTVRQKKSDDEFNAATGERLMFAVAETESINNMWQVVQNHLITLAVSKQLLQPSNNA